MFPGVLLPTTETFVSVAAPVDGTSAVHTVTLAAGVDGGHFRLNFAGFGAVQGGLTDQIPYNADAAAVQTIVDAVLGANNSVIGGSLDAGLTITYGAALGRVAYPLPKVTYNHTTVAGVAAANPTVAETTAGVNATLRGVLPGTIVYDQTTLDAWVNRGTADAPKWCPLSGVWRNAGAPTNGTTFAGKARIGDLLVDTTGKKLYINTNTQASPTWTVVGTQS